MNPFIRILCLMVLAALLPGLSLSAVSVLAWLLLGLYAWLAGDQFQRLLRGLLRLRWLFLAIFVLYLGFTPGDPVVAQLPGLSREGMFEGARRSLILLDLLTAVYLLLVSTPIPALVQGINRGLWPLRAIGLDPAAFSLRLALALDQVGGMQARISELRNAKGSLLDAAAELIRGLEAHPESIPAAVSPAMLGPGPAPRYWEWLLPVALGSVLWWSPV